MVGSKLICIDSSKLPSMVPQFVASQLIEGNEYTIKRVVFQEVQQEYAVELEEIEFPIDCIFKYFLLKRFIPKQDIKIEKEVVEEELELA